MKQKEQTTFDFVFCSATKVKSISKTVTYAGSTRITLDDNSTAISNYHTYSSNRIGDKQWKLKLQLK